MAELTSNGLMRYGHFTSSKRAMDLDEPLYLNQYTIRMDAADLPPAMQSTQDDVNIILEGVRSIGGLETQPGVGSAAVQKYKWSERGYAGAAPTKTHLDLSVTFELNLRRVGDTDDNYTYKFLRRWCDVVYDPQTGRMSIKKNYICKKWVITMMDKENVPFHQWTVYNIFPTSAVPAPQLNYDTNGIWQGFSMTFWADTFDESIT